MSVTTEWPNLQGVPSCREVPKLWPAAEEAPELPSQTSGQHPALPLTQWSHHPNTLLRVFQPQEAGPLPLPCFLASQNTGVEGLGHLPSPTASDCSSLRVNSARGPVPDTGHTERNVINKWRALLVQCLVLSPVLAFPHSYKILLIPSYLTATTDTQSTPCLSPTAVLTLTWRVLLEKVVSICPLQSHLLFVPETTDQGLGPLPASYQQTLVTENKGHFLALTWFALPKTFNTTHFPFQILAHLNLYDSPHRHSPPPLCQHLFCTPHWLSCLFGQIFLNHNFTVKLKSNLLNFYYKAVLLYIF